MSLQMNLMHHPGVARALGLGGWYALKGQTEVGTIVAFASGLTRMNNPWRDAVNWFREMTEVRVRYRLVAEAARSMRDAPAAQSAT